jgi:purine-binding chemotaxis protein CheW
MNSSGKMPEPGVVEATAARRFLTFRLDKRLYALRAEDVAEVILIPAVARVPQSPPALVGIANLRGAVLPVVSLRGLLGRAENALDSNAKAIVLDVGAPIAMIVDATEALLSVDTASIEEREAELGAETGELLSGAFRVDAEQDVARVLDIQHLLDAAFAQRARSQRLMGGMTAVARQQQSLANAQASEMLVSFEVAGQEFALDLSAVQEVLPAPASLMAVPRSETLVLGVTSLREKLLPLFSLRGLLGFPLSPAKSAREKVVVTTVGGMQVGLVADGARSVMVVESSRIDPIPQILAARTKGEARIRAIYRGEGDSGLVSILAPEQLFREDVMQRLGQARDIETTPQQHAPSDVAQQSRDQQLQFLVFRLGDDEFALPIATIDEVAQMPAKITRVPKTPKFLEGVINLHGEVLPVVDQRRRFEMPAYERPQARRLLVLRTAQYRAGVIVDSVSDVLRIAADSVEPAPDLTEQTARLVRGVINLENSGRIVLLLDPTELLTPAEQGLLSAFQKTGQANA